MADIRPFMSIRPEKGKAAKIAALPYDVYNRKEATEEVEKNPESFLKIDPVRKRVIRFPWICMTTECTKGHTICCGGW